jgi:hypothetical protein
LLFCVTHNACCFAFKDLYAANPSNRIVQFGFDLLSTTRETCVTHIRARMHAIRKAEMLVDFAHLA